MSRLRLSHTFLLLWSQGRYNDALNAYFHKPVEKTQALKDGIAYHEKWADIIQKKGTIRFGDTIFTFKSPEVEKKIVVSYNDRWDLSGVYDCLDDGGVYEWKTGVMSSLEYMQSYQAGIYFVIGEIAGIPIDRCVIAHYNQHTDKSDISIVWNTDYARERARDFIDGLAPEIEQYFIDNNLPLDKPGK